MDQRDASDRRLDVIDVRFEALDQRFEDLQQYLEARIDGLRYELLAAFRGELVKAVVRQQRVVIVVLAVALFGVGGIAVAIAQAAL